MKTILVPLDGSELSEQVLPHVRRLASTLGAGVRLLRVVPEQEVEHLVPDYVLQYEAGAPPEAAPPQCIDTLSLQWRSAEAYLDEQALRLRVYGLSVDTVVQCGPVAELIATYAESPSTMIAMATHGRGGLRRWALGSVADQLLHCAPCPLFLVRGGTDTPPPALRRVMVALDGSPLARRALAPALELCRRASAELVLFEAAVPRVEQYGGVYMLPLADELERRDQALADLNALADHLREPNVPISAVATVGYPPQEIVNEAARRHVDLIVMATHGRGGLRRLALGSVADRVLHATTTPLLLVRAAG